jgi:hypothetical protein
LIPYIVKGDLTKLPKRRQKKICGCSLTCTEFYTFNTEDEFILCAGDAKKFAFEILEQLGIISKTLAFPYSVSGWTTMQEHLIKKFLSDPNVYYNGKVKYGTYSRLGEMLGKSREQVKKKIQHMQKEGKL